MQISSDKDFEKVAKHLKKYKTHFPLFVKDINKIENTIIQYQKNYSNFMVSYRQSKRNASLVRANEEIDKINHLISTLDKIELMALMAKNSSG